MKSFSASLVTVALLAAGAAAQDFQINTPNPPTQCVPTRFTWSGGTPPYFLPLTHIISINPGGQVGATALQQYSGLTGDSFTWPTNITAGTSIGLTLNDAAGNVAQSAPFSIQAGPDSSCLNGGQTTAAGSTDAGSSTAAGTTPGSSAAGTTSPAGTSGAPTSAGSGTTARSSATTGGSSSTPSASATGGAGSNGAISNVASAGVVGIIGAVAAALLA